MRTLLVLWCIAVGQQQCTASCPHPGSPKFGRLINATWTRFPRGHSIEYTCDEGQVLFGEPRRLCTESDRWEPPEVPQCLNNLVAVKNDLKIQHNRDGSAEILKSFDKDYCQSIGGIEYIWNVTLLESALVTNLEVRFRQTPETLADEEAVGQGKIEMEAWMETPTEDDPDAGRVMCDSVTVLVPMRKNSFQLVCNGNGTVVNLKLVETSVAAVTVDICTIAVLSPDTMPPKLCYNPNNKDIIISTMDNMCFYLNTKRFNANNSALMCSSIHAEQLSREEVMRRPNLKYFVHTFLAYVKKDEIEVFFRCPADNRSCATFKLDTDIDTMEKVGKIEAEKANVELQVLCKAPPIHCGVPFVATAATKSKVEGIWERQLKTGFIPEYPVGVNVTYSCWKGFTMVGPERITCLENGEYDMEPPLCEWILPVTETFMALIVFGTMLLIWICIVLKEIFMNWLFRRAIELKK